MKKSLLSLFLLFSLSHAAGTYDGISFTDAEEEIGLYLCNYAPKQTFLDLGYTDTQAVSVISSRPFPTMLDCSNSSGMTVSNTQYLNQYTHFFDYKLMTNDMGMTERDYQFLMGLTGLLSGFVFLLGFILIIVNKRRH